MGLPTGTGKPIIRTEVGLYARGELMNTQTDDETRMEEIKARLRQMAILANEWSRGRLLAPGEDRFAAETGYTKFRWTGDLWANYGELVADAGLEQRRKKVAADPKWLFEKLVVFIRAKNKFPSNAEFRLRRREAVRETTQCIDETSKKEADFPSWEAIQTAAGSNRNRRASKAEVAGWIIAMCDKYASVDDAYDDITAFCRGEIGRPVVQRQQEEYEPGVKIGYVYLRRFVKSRIYKIGRTFRPIERERETDAGDREGIETIHEIRTDDPVGVEKYWLNRFDAKRKRAGIDHFELNHKDVSAFKKWKRIC